MTTTSNTTVIDIAKYTLTNGSFEYTVLEKDTLSSIITALKVKAPRSVVASNILKESNLEKISDVVKNVKITIPYTYLNKGTSYTVKSGDTLFSIATDKYPDLSIDAAVKKLKEDNFITNDVVKIGDELYIVNE